MNKIKVNVTYTIEVADTVDLNTFEGRWFVQKWILLSQFDPAFKVDYEPPAEIGMVSAIPAMRIGAEDEEWFIGYKQGVRNERYRALDILSMREWHENSKSYTQTDTDLSHISEYCSACQMMELLTQEEKTNDANN